MPETHISERMCAACRKRGYKSEFYRFVRSDNGFVVLDNSQKKSGRGMYLCKSSVCLHKAEKSKAAERALHASISKDFYGEILKLLEDING